MRFSILSKFLSLVLILSIVPLVIVGYISVKYVFEMEDESVHSIEEMQESAVLALNELGEVMIKQTALQVARQLEIYVKENPHLTVADLQNDEYFLEIAVQSVGETGYTAVHESETIINRFHVNPAIVNMDLHVLEESLPDFYELISRNQGGNSADGYYNWEDEDGEIRKKYMYIAVVDAYTADDVQFSVAATTYIDEFSVPSQEMTEMLYASSLAIQDNLNKAAMGLYRSVVITLIIMFIVVVVLSLLFTSTITAPIKKLREMVRQVANGDFEFRGKIKANDEIGDLATDFARMTKTLSEQRKSLESYSKNLEDKVKDRTKKLEDINKITVGRELDMVKMKEEVDELKKILEDKDQEE